LVKLVRFFKDIRKLDVLKEPIDMESQQSLLHYVANKNKPRLMKILVEDAGLNVNAKNVVRSF
jgi:hypothetical protein